ncbi:MAG: ROK family protein [Planctomycetaceae bacterium]|nr:ROK family protein [Planctomycetaceae bacterium]
MTGSDNRIFLGIDLGGTNIKAGVVRDNGTVIQHASVPTEASAGPDHGVQQILRAAREALKLSGVETEQITAAGLATPGTMNIPAGMLLDPPNLPGWDDFPIRQKVADALGIPTILQNDANAAAYGEYWVGSAKTARSLVFFTLGTGLGSGIIVEDMIIEGDHSHGSECGHVILEMDNGRLCATGQSGTAEAYCSATALMKRFAEEIENGRSTSVLQRVPQSDVTPLMIAEEAEHGDHLCVELIMEMARYLGVAITSSVHVIDPSVVLLGGAMTFGRHETRIGREFLHRVRQEFKSRTFTTLVEKVTIDYASLGSHAGFIGAAGCARRALDRGTLVDRTL